VDIHDSALHDSLELLLDFGDGLLPSPSRYLVLVQLVDLGGRSATS
jgi:hypothetical protein